MHHSVFEDVLKDVWLRTVKDCILNAARPEYVCFAKILTIYTLVMAVVADSA
jgi:hypothetical protein